MHIAVSCPPVAGVKSDNEQDQRIIFVEQLIKMPFHWISILCHMKHQRSECALHAATRELGAIYYKTDLKCLTYPCTPEVHMSLVTLVHQQTVITYIAYCNSIEIQYY